MDRYAGFSRIPLLAPPLTMHTFLQALLSSTEIAVRKPPILMSSLAEYNMGQLQGRVSRFLVSHHCNPRNTDAGKHAGV